MTPHPEPCPVGRWLHLPPVSRGPRPACACPDPLEAFAQAAREAGPGPGERPGTVGVLDVDPGARVRVELAAGAHLTVLDLVAVDEGGDAVYRGHDGARGWELRIPGETWRAEARFGRRLQVTASAPAFPLT